VTARSRVKASYDAEGPVRLGRAILDCLLVQPTLWKDASGLGTDKFVLPLHSKVFSAIKRLNDSGQCADIVSVCASLGEEVDPADVSALVDSAVPENFRAYIHQLNVALRDRQFHLLREQLGKTETVEGQREVVSQMQDVLATTGSDDNWRSIFHTWEECECARPLNFRINGFLQEAGITVVGGLSGHGKTLLMLGGVKALLEGTPLFGYERFTVPCPAARVLYLIPESSLGPFWSRVQLFRLGDYVRNDRLLIRTLSCPEQVPLADPRLLKAAEGADVFLDTAVRFMDGSENEVESARPFADTLFRLLNSGARSICGAHHSPKSFEGQDYMTLENILRGSGDLGAMLCTCWGVRQIDAGRNQLYVQNVKPRDFEPCEPFILEGRPHLDMNGQFKMLQEPGEAGELRSHLRQKGGRPAVVAKDDKVSRAVELRNSGASLREISRALGVSKSSVDRWLFDHDLSQGVPKAGQFRDSAEPDGETPN
jgi:hypothetical protein